jgi:putative SOS response-associated peptidase YedK
MCGRYALYADPALIARTFRADVGTDLTLSFNIAPGQNAPVIRMNHGKRELVALRWGLVPPWSRGPDSRLSMINARADSVAKKPAYREAFRRRRCLIPASGFYEWGKGKGSRTPFYLRQRSRTLMALAGLWEHWGKDGTAIESFVIIVTSASGASAEIHDWTPVVLAQGNWDAWLTVPPERAHELLPLLEPRDIPFRIVEVGLLVNDPKNDGPELIEPASKVG